MLPRIDRLCLSDTVFAGFLHVIPKGKYVVKLSNRISGDTSAFAGGGANRRQQIERRCTKAGYALKPPWVCLCTGKEVL